MYKSTLIFFLNENISQLLLFYVLFVSLRCSTYCLCVNGYCTTATGCHPTAVNKYIIPHHIVSYHIIPYHIISHHIIPHHIISYRIISYHTVSYNNNNIY